MSASYIAYVCALLPIITVHLTLAIALTAGNLEPCVPYWSQCHSISATGRQYPEFFVFKGLVIPIAIAMMVYWIVLRRWLTLIGLKDAGKTLSVLGLIAGIALIVYTTTLGAVGEPYALARRIGVILFFAFTSLAHLLLLSKLNVDVLETQRLKSEHQRLFILCFGLLFLGILSAILGFLWEGYSNWDNALEWWFSLLMMGQFFMVGRMWRKTNLSLNIQTN